MLMTATLNYDVGRAVLLSALRLGGRQGCGCKLYCNSALGCADTAECKKFALSSKHTRHLHTLWC